MFAMREADHEVVRFIGSSTGAQDRARMLHRLRQFSLRVRGRFTWLQRQQNVAAGDNAYDPALHSCDEQYALAVLECEHSQGFRNVGIYRDGWNIMIRDISNTPRFPFACRNLTQRCHGDSSDGLLVL